MRIQFALAEYTWCSDSFARIFSSRDHGDRRVRRLARSAIYVYLILRNDEEYARARAYAVNA